MLGQVFQRPALIQQLGERLTDTRDVGKILEVVRVAAVQDDSFAAVGPYADGRSLGVAVALQLLKTVGTFRFLAFDDDVRGVRCVFVPDHDVGRLLVDGGAELNGFFNGDALGRVAVVIHQHFDVELSDDFFGLGGPVLPSGIALQVRLPLFGENLEGLNNLGLEDRQRMRRAAENVFNARHL